MRRRGAIAIALLVGVVSLSLINIEPTAYAAKERVFSFDTGIITLGRNQLLRIVTNNSDPEAAYVVRFTQMAYAGTATVGGSRWNVVAQTTSEPTTVPPGEGFSIDVGTSESVVRGVVISNTESLQVTAHIIDTSTGNIIAILIGLK